MSKQNNWIKPGNRVMDVAYIRDGDVVHRGEALLLAVLLHAKGRTKRASNEMQEVAKMLDDPNINKKRKPRKR